MKTLCLLTAFAAIASTFQLIANEKKAPIPNRLIDAREYSRVVSHSVTQRENRRLSEAEFLAAMKEPGTVLLDARSAPRFAERHLTGAVNLPFTDFTAETLAKVIPGKTTKILIYCNNNFLGDQGAFASKSPAASLNLSTWASLEAYGYTNILELGPLVDVRKSILPFSGSSVK